MELATAASRKANDETGGGSPITGCQPGRTVITRLHFFPSLDPSPVHCRKSRLGFDTLLASGDFVFPRKKERRTAFLLLQNYLSLEIHKNLRNNRD